MSRIFGAVFALLPLSFHPGNAVAETWALQGTIIAPDKVIPNGTVVVSDETIAAVGDNLDPPKDAKLVKKFSGVILPGLVDLHNHITWNVFPRWVPPHKFSNRYEWQAIPEYDQTLRIPENRLLANGRGCKANLFGEVKALAGGATSVVGTLVGRTDEEKACVIGLARNLDHSSGFPKEAPKRPCATPPTVLSAVVNEVFPLEATHERVDELRCELEQGSLRALLVHLAEGKPSDAASRREFKMLSARGLLLPGLVVIHGTALAIEDFAAMKEKGVGLVWSPRSNDELYGGTTNIAAARNAGVPIAIAPDWSPSGSAGMLQEIGYAASRYGILRASEFVAMATAIPAKLVRADDRIGALKPGALADLLVLKGRGGAAYDTIVTATPADVELVVVGGVPVYGDDAVMRELLPGKRLDEFTVCGSKKALFLGAAGAAPVAETWDEIRRDLEEELQRYGSNLGGIECN
jgi:5-methylthioadenosine/S-adenosylhomocysteine deaminase